MQGGRCPAEKQDAAGAVRPGGGREVGCGARGIAEEAGPHLGDGSGRPCRAGPRRQGRHGEWASRWLRVSWSRVWIAACYDGGVPRERLGAALGPPAAAQGLTGAQGRF